MTYEQLRDRLGWKDSTFRGYLDPGPTSPMLSVHHAKLLLTAPREDIPLLLASPQACCGYLDLPEVDDRISWHQDAALPWLQAILEAYDEETDP
jgi:hypothetical protein